MADAAVPNAWQQLMQYAPTAIDQQENIPGAATSAVRDVPGFGKINFGLSPSSGAYSNLTLETPPAEGFHTNLVEGQGGGIASMALQDMPDKGFFGGLFEGAKSIVKGAWPVLAAFGAYYGGFGGAGAAEGTTAASAAGTTGMTAAEADAALAAFDTAVPSSAIDTAVASTAAGTAPASGPGVGMSTYSHGVQPSAPVGERSFNASLGDKIFNSSPSMLSSSLLGNPQQLLSSFAPGGSSAGFGGLSNVMNFGSGLYGMYQSQKLREMAAKAASGADTWGSTGGRALASTQLQALMKDPSSITTLPGYDAGMQAVQRAMAAQGYTGSGNAMIALQKYGGDFYNNAIAQLSQLAGAQFNPASAAGIGISGAESANDLASRSLASLGYGMQRAAPNPITSWLQ